MNKINYDLELECLVKKNKAQNKREKLLLHACCAPCSSYCIELLKNHFEITIFFYNPNMDTLEEYNKRAEEQKRFCAIEGVNCIIADYDKQDFLSLVKGLENEKEGGFRCEKCFSLRLNKTANYAKENGYDYFATTLTVSPLKNAELINKIGLQIESEVGAKYLPTDFKKRGGYLKSVELSKEYGLYRQNYCGCEFSKEKAKTL